MRFNTIDDLRADSYAFVFDFRGASGATSEKKRKVVKMQHTTFAASGHV
jgi:hypothetical protein